MFFETILFMLLGICIGIFFGITPGFHVNLAITTLFPFAFLFPSPYQFVVLIVSVSCTEMFIDYIPSIFIGAPDADTALSVLPGHRLLFEGRGYEAIKLTVIGGLGALMVGLLMIALVANVFGLLYDVSRPYMQYIILGVIGFMIISEKKPKKMLSAALIISLSGFLGLITLNSSLVPQQEVLFPVLTGLFGLSGLMISLSEKAGIPEQKDDVKLKIKKKEIVKSVVLAAFAGILVGFLPAVGISEAAVMMQYVGGSNTARSFLITTSGINVANDLFSFISLWLVGNPRSGASVAIQQILTELTFFDVLFLIGSIFFTAGIAAMLTLYLGKKIPKLLVKLNYRYLNISVIIFIVVLVFLLTGFYGLLIAFTSASIGMLCVQLKIRRSHCMGVLLCSTVLFFTGLSPTVISLLGI